jgi:hypothetical protein
LRLAPFRCLDTIYNDTVEFPGNLGDIHDRQPIWIEKGTTALVFGPGIKAGFFASTERRYVNPALVCIRGFSYAIDGLAETYGDGFSDRGETGYANKFLSRPE